MELGLEDRGAFSRVELLAVLSVVVLLGLVWTKAQADPEDERQPPVAQARNRINCVNNLKQLGLGLRMFANDHNDRFPMQIPAAKGGSQEGIEEMDLTRHFKALVAELVSPKILTCPADDRQRVAVFAELKNKNLSYFLGIDADEARPQMLLSGDRNLTNGMAPLHGVLELSDKPAVGWTEALHDCRGNIGLADGSVQQTTTVILRRTIDHAKESNKQHDGKTRIQLPVIDSSSSE